MHVGGHVRDAFWAAFEFVTKREKGQSAERVFLAGLSRWMSQDGYKGTHGSLVGALLHCTDILPDQGQDIRDAGFEFGKNTYAAATRAILADCWG